MTSGGSTYGEHRKPKRIMVAEAQCACACAMVAVVGEHGYKAASVEAVIKRPCAARLLALETFTVSTRVLWRRSRLLDRLPR